MNLQWIENGEITHIYFMMLLFVIKYQMKQVLFKVEISINIVKLKKISTIKDFRFGLHILPTLKSENCTFQLF
jgi:hypothetical protein